MALKMRFTCRTGRFAELAVLIRLTFGGLILCSCAAPILAPAVAAEVGGLKSEIDAAESTPQRYRVFLLKFISAQEGIQFLADVNITTVSRLNDANMLLVTARQETLVRAASLLTLVDSREKFAVKVLMPASEASRMPAADAIAAEIGNISIGTFFNLPGGTGHKAIIDVHDGMLIAIAPASVMERIVAIAERAAPISAKRPAEGNEPPQGEIGEADKLFNELLGSLAEAQAPAVLLRKSEAAGGDEKAPSSAAAAKPLPLRRVEEPNAAPIPAEAPGATGPDVNAHPAMRDEERETSDERVRRSYEPQMVPNADETLELALPEKLDIISLLDLVGKYLNFNYVYTQQTLAGKEVNLKVQGPIKVKELYPLVESVLKFTGLAMTRKGNLVTIVPLETALDIDPALIQGERGEVQYGDVVVTRVFQLSYINTASARTLIEGMKVGAVTELPATGTIIVTGYAYRMSRVEELLEIIDKPGRPKQFKFRQLKYTMAKTLAPKVKQLVEQMGDISIAIAKPETPAQPSRRRLPSRRPPSPPTPEPSKPTIYLDADERTNRILMIGQEEELGVVEDLIDALDVEQQDLRSLRMYEIQHVDAKEVRGKLEELGIIGAGRATTPGRITTRAVAPRAPGGAPSPTPTPGGEAELPTEELQVVVIESTNSLLVNASPEQHALIATIIAYVDSETLQQAIPYVVYPLENQKPTDLAEVLNKLIQETIRDEKGKIQQVIKRQEDEIIIVSDENTFSLIVFASKKNQEWISSLIKSLDKRRPQVLIDVTLVEISEVDAFTYDLQLISKFPEMLPGGSMQKLGAGEAALLSPFPFNRVQEATSILGDTGGGKGFYADRHIQALLQLMEKKGYGRVLAKPKILVNDNEKGHIDTTSTIYVSRSSSTVYTTATTPTGEAPISTSYTFDQFPSGITLDITPHISEGTLLRLELKMTRSSQVAPQGGIQANQAPPDKTENNVETVVTVPDNSTIILGGILTLDQTKKNWKVPLLGDVPIVGGLFRKIDDSSTQKKLYVFVKANILRPGEGETALADIKLISEKNRAAFEKSETDIQIYEELPGIKPKPMKPTHVIDAE